MPSAAQAAGSPRLTASFSEDMTVALESVLKLGGFTYEIALFGHGEPLTEGASTAVAALAAG